MRRRPNGQGSRIGCVLVLAIAAALLVVLYQGGRWLEQRSERPESRGDYRQRHAYDTVLEYKGASYRLRRGLTTLLLMGVDQPSEHIGSGYRSGGQADFLRLVVLDHAKHRISQLAIDRDTMTPITILGVLGNRSGTRTAQISLSHGFGDGGAESCALTADAVSNLMLNTPVDCYVAMNLDGISAFNDLLGGVTVTLEDDFSALDPEMTPGATLTLQGEQAEIYVRSRMDIGLGTNEARMRRQEEYLAQAASLMNGRLREDREFIGTVYDALDGYLVTDMSRGQMINEAWTARAYEQTELIRLEGVHQVGTDGFMQFYVDEASLQEAVVELFYERVK